MVTYDYYRIFYFVAQYHSFTKAAELLHNNQPNITRCMNNLEQELECKLFVRSNRGITLTPEGQQLYSHVSIAYDHLQYGEAELKKDRSLESGLITIGASETALRLFLLEKLESFHAQYPNVRLKISNHSTPEAIASLENGLVDFSVITSPMHIGKNLRQYPLSTYREILLGGSKYEVLGKKSHALQELSEYQFISLGKGTGTRDLYVQYFMNHDLTFQPDMEVATTDQILPFISHNLGIGFYPEALAAKALASGEVLAIPLKEPCPLRQICLVVDHNRPQSISVRKLIQELTNCR
ncbi:MAG: LysR family transcriptional regulator [Lachnospiraceae bacterium]|nr:LysR family transcriptional regulator [Lachnospiraceae bacterium]